MAKIDLRRFRDIKHDIDNKLTIIELSQKPSVVDRAQEELLVLVEELVAICRTPLARGTQELAKLETEAALAGVVPEPVLARHRPLPYRATPSQILLPRRRRGDTFEEDTTLTGAELKDLDEV